MTEDVEVRFGLQLIHISDLVCKSKEEKRWSLLRLFRMKKTKY
jgi:hypothetical protein